MAVYRVDYLCDDQRAVFQWQRENFSAGSIIRSVAYKTNEGWYIKTVFRRQEDAETYHRYLYPDKADHSVPVFSAPVAG